MVQCVMFGVDSYFAALKLLLLLLYCNTRTMCTCVEECWQSIHHREALTVVDGVPFVTSYNFLSFVF